MTDEQVRALALLSEALETVERARGHLYSFHQLSGHADAQVQDAVAALREAGAPELADAVDAEVVGRNVVHGRWTFQLVEDYDDGYWSVLRSWEARARDELAGGARHLYEAEMKKREATPGRPGHELSP